MSFDLLFLAVALEAAAGYPQALVRRIGHPVIWIGNLIGALDRALNHENQSFALRRMAGVEALFILLAVTGIVAGAVEWAFRAMPYGVLLLALPASALLAQRSLYEHVVRVARALENEGLDAGRAAVSQIVGRDPESLDEAGVSRAAIESLAENYSDGIVAPAFWIAVGGLTGGVLYKAINTADSMIGHRTERHEAFGWASARLDDLVNIPASRLSAIFIMLAALVTPGASAFGAFKAVWRDAPNHRSPNAGYPEAAMAGALGLALAGPRSYGGVMVQDFTMGQGRREASAADIRAALRLYRHALMVQGAVIAVLAAIALV